MKHPQPIVVEQPVIVEFTLINPNTNRIKKKYFMGATLDDVIIDVQGDKFFRLDEIKDQRIVLQPEAGLLRLANYDAAYESIRTGGQKSWYLEAREGNYV